MKRLPRGVLLLTSTLLLAGCYERTLNTRGIGGYGRASQEPYASDTKADRAVDKWMGREQKPPFKHAPGDIERR